ncbi:hypothetical protein EV127DRAFT_348176 [Xylaria flabelliformis]|nr:hypothetical protein EV127DRAFT_348176 [Xylaria flabelliformis]
MEPQQQAHDANQKGEQVIFGTKDGRAQPWRAHWQPGPKGDLADKLRGFSKGQQITLGGTSGNDGESEHIFYDSKSEE